MKLFLAFMMMTTVLHAADEIPVQQMREMYYNASKSSAASDKFYELMKRENSTSPLALGYQAMAEFMKCYHSFNPVTKLTYFGKGKSNLDRAIQNDPQNIELRYLRFTVQTNIPFFLNYSSSVNEDKQFIISNFSSQGDTALKQMIRDYMVSCDACSEEEKTFFQNTTL